MFSSGTWLFDFLKLAPTALGACSQKGKSAISYTITATCFGTDVFNSRVFFIRKLEEKS